MTTATSLRVRGGGGRGFTLIELLMVISVIMILAAMILALASYMQTSAASSRAKVEMAAITAAAESFKVRYGEFPRAAATEALIPSIATPGTENYKTAAAYLTAFLCGSSALLREDQENRDAYKEFKRWPILLPIAEKSFSQDTVTITVPNLVSQPGEPSTLSVKVRYLLDPFGTPYGYSTRGEMSAPGFFDLWSSAGTSSTSQTNKWITNW